MSVIKKILQTKSQTKQNKLKPLSNCAICGKRPAFIKNQELRNFNNI